MPSFGDGGLAEYRVTSKHFTAAVFTARSPGGQEIVTRVPTILRQFAQAPRHVLQRYVVNKGWTWEHVG